MERGSHLCLASRPGIPLHGTFLPTWSPRLRWTPVPIGTARAPSRTPSDVKSATKSVPSRTRTFALSHFRKRPRPQHTRRKWPLEALRTPTNKYLGEPRFSQVPQMCAHAEAPARAQRERRRPAPVACQSAELSPLALPARSALVARQSAELSPCRPPDEAGEINRDADTPRYSLRNTHKCCGARDEGADITTTLHVWAEIRKLPCNEAGMADPSIASFVRGTTLQDAVHMRRCARTIGLFRMTSGVQPQPLLELAWLRHDRRCRSPDHYCWPNSPSQSQPERVTSARIPRNYMRSFPLRAAPPLRGRFAHFGPRSVHCAKELVLLCPAGRSGISGFWAVSWGLFVRAVLGRLKAPRAPMFPQAGACTYGNFENQTHSKRAMLGVPASRRSSIQEPFFYTRTKPGRAGRHTQLPEVGWGRTATTTAP